MKPLPRGYKLHASCSFRLCSSAILRAMGYEDTTLSDSAALMPESRVIPPPLMLDNGTHESQVVPLSMALENEFEDEQTSDDEHGLFVSENDHRVSMKDHESDIESPSVERAVKLESLKKEDLSKQGPSPTMSIDQYPIATAYESSEKRPSVFQCLSGAPTYHAWQERGSTQDIESTHSSTRRGSSELPRDFASIIDLASVSIPNDARNKQFALHEITTGIPASPARDLWKDMTPLRSPGGPNRVVHGIDTMPYLPTTQFNISTQADRFFTMPTRNPREHSVIFPKIPPAHQKRKVDEISDDTNVAHAAGAWESRKAFSPPASKPTTDLEAAQARFNAAVQERERFKKEYETLRLQRDRETVSNDILDF